MFFFDKRCAEKLHKPKRKETIAEIFRFSVRQLDRFRHPKMLNLLHPVEESSDTLAFATEPVLASLANILGYLEDRLPQNLPHNLREYSFVDFEIKYGLLQVCGLPIFKVHLFALIQIKKTLASLCMYLLDSIGIAIKYYQTDKVSLTST